MNKRQKKKFKKKFGYKRWINHKCLHAIAKCVRKACGELYDFKEIPDVRQVLQNEIDIGAVKIIPTKRYKYKMPTGFLPGKIYNLYDNLEEVKDE